MLILRGRGTSVPVYTSFCTAHPPELSPHNGNTPAHNATSPGSVAFAPSAVLLSDWLPILVV